MLFCVINTKAQNKREGMAIRHITRSDRLFRVGSCDFVERSPSSL